MKKLRKGIAMALAAALALSITACGGTGGSGGTTSSGSAGSGSGSTGGSDYPNETISFVVPYAAGDGLDLSCRAMLDNIDLPVNTLVENISGGSGTIGLQDAFNRDADGYTVAILSNGPTIAQPLLNDTLAYKLEDWDVLTFITAPVLAVLGCSDKLGIQTAMTCGPIWRAATSSAWACPL